MEFGDYYFEWLISIIASPETSYSQLLWYLYSEDFYSSIPMDSNREKDGLDLRNTFKKINGLPYSDNFYGIFDRNCSVLEVMVALSIRCEDYMVDSEIGDRTGFWFGNMIKSLGLESLNDDYFDIRIAKPIVSRFLDREYNYNGEGGLFTIIDPPYDMRTTELWYQMNLYLKQFA